MTFNRFKLASAKVYLVEWDPTLKITWMKIKLTKKLASLPLSHSSHGVCIFFFFSADKAVGCDHGFESGTRKDRCAVCGGNGETCKFEKSSYTKDHRSYGKFTA